MTHKFKIGDKVIFTNVFGVCFGVNTISGLDVRTNRPTYFYEESDTPWFSTCETNLQLADEEDFGMSNEELQAKYGFTPKEYFGCY